jgi:hypothetical protein
MVYKISAEGEIDMLKTMRLGEMPPRYFKEYERDYFTRRIKHCFVLIYPIMRGLHYARLAKVSLYHYLNQSGLMHTPTECKMTFSDLFRR